MTQLMKYWFLLAALSTAGLGQTGFTDTAPSSTIKPQGVQSQNA